MSMSVRLLRLLLLVLCAALVLAAGCQAKSDDSTDDTPPHEQTVPHEGAWGIYALDLSTRDVELIWSGNDTITCRCLNHAGDKLAFTRNSQIWTVKDDGSDARQVTSPPRAGQWGNANLPFGDYDPCFSPDGGRIVFERLEDDTISHGNYNIFAVNSDGTGETRLTDTGYSQGLATWSHSGDRLVYVVAAIGSQGQFDIHLMQADGSNEQNITPDYFPGSFLCHSALFSKDDSKVYFTGQWYS